MNAFNVFKYACAVMSIIQLANQSLENGALLGCAPKITVAQSEDLKKKKQAWNNSTCTFIL